ncbi:MAG: recombination mediator RecR [Planctomycetota bacterium]|nr:recombination mediator RecR [Planctomycetota bacterium]
MSQASHTSAMNRLIQQLTRLPGIGKRSAERIAFHLLKQSPEDSFDLAAAIRDLKANVHHCSICFNLTESDPCPICADPQRDRGLVLVVEQPSDVVSLETTGMYRGTYHVLMGRLSPLEGVGPGELNIDALVKRVEVSHMPDAGAGTTPIREVILGTNPNLEGDGTSMYLASRLAKLKMKVSRLARGLPTGVSLEAVSKAVLADAIQGRQEMS